MREVGAFEGACHGKVDGHRLQGGRLGLGFGERGPGLIGGHVGLLAGRSPAVNADVRQLADLARQVLDVRAGAPVDLGRVLARENRDLVSYR